MLQFQGEINGHFERGDANTAVLLASICGLSVGLYMAVEAYAVGMQEHSRTPPAEKEGRREVERNGVGVETK
jgi:hypothetical protein